MSLKHAILVLLETEPSSGYNLLKQFNEGLGYFWNAKHQQIYQQLKVLSGQKYISYTVEEQQGKPDKKIYKITKVGVKALKEWISSPIKPSKVNDALLVKFYGGHLTTEQNLLEELDRHIEMRQKTLNKLLGIEKTYFLLPPNKQQKYQLPFLTLRRGILGEQAWLSWATEAKQTIKK